MGASVKLSATVRSSGATPTGTVTFWLGTRKLCAGTLFKGSTHCSARFYSAGTKTITGKYSGNATHRASSGTAKVQIVRSPTTTKITNVNPSNVDSGKAFTFHVTVTVPAGTPAATGSVRVAPTAPLGLPSVYACTATLSGGKGSCTIHPPAYGIVDYRVSYLGSRVHISSKSTVPFELAVQNVTTTTVTPSAAAAGSVTLTATVNAGGANISAANGGTGSAAFYIGGTVVTGCAAQLLTFTAGANVATCTVTLAASTTPYDVTAVFSGDPVNVGSTSPVDELLVS